LPEVTFTVRSLPIAVGGEVGPMNGSFRGQRIHTPEPLLPVGLKTVPGSCLPPFSCELMNFGRTRAVTLRVRPKAKLSREGVRAAPYGEPVVRCGRW
jgi:hypothetical protein